MFTIASTWQVLEYVKTLPEEVVDKLAKEVETLTFLDLFETLEMFN